MPLRTHHLVIDAHDLPGLLADPEGNEFCVVAVRLSRT